MLHHSLTLPILLLCVSAPHAPAADPATPAPDQTTVAIAYFEKHVRPLLIRRCYSCHSARAKPLRGNLRLDTRTGWQTGGESGPAIRPGRPDDSLLIQAVRYDDDSLQMPPKKKLDPADIRILERWVAAGAADPRTDNPKTGRRGTSSHWAFRPIATPAAEPVDATGPMKWIRTPVDRYVLARLTAARLTPADSATRRVLLRRVCFDLTGLPPSPRQITAFLADTRPGAWERVIERLLASPHYGQKWGRHWLDVARYADSNGLDENIAHGNAWRYRDWVIDSLNADRPFDEFLRNQIAGDRSGLQGTL
jgi:mono/diheme cytochrome c family protein